MNRNIKPVYCFIYDDAKKFYRAHQTPDGSWSITSNAQIYPLKHNPKNLVESPVEFATNKKYFSMNRTINYPLEFIFDGAAILNYKYTTGKGVNQNLYFAMFEFDDSDGIYKLSYNGKFDFQGKKRNEKIATFTVSVIDDSAWGVLSQNDDVQYSIDCSENNPKTIKVLFDNFTLQNRYTFQTVQGEITSTLLGNYMVIPFVLVNQDGDSSGIISKSQTLDYSTNINTYVQNPNAADYCIYTYYPLNNVRIQGSFTFTWSTNTLPSGGIKIFFITSTLQERVVFSQLGGGLIPGQIYNFTFDFTINLAAGEKIFFIANLNDNVARHFQITPIVTNIFISTLTKAESKVCFALRPLDLLKSIVKRATLERYTIGSNFFEVNNKTVLIPGDQFRGIKNSKIYTSFKDFFDTFSALFFMALRVKNGSLFMELADEVYKQGTNIIDLGELIECETSPANEYYGNEIEVGSPKQDYRHPSGRLEFNSVNTFSLPFLNIKNKISFVTKYRTDCYGMIFLMLDYNSQSTTDNSGDKSVFVVDITDEQAAAIENVETFENITVDNAPLAPIIKYPLTGDNINNDTPLLRGIGIPGTNVNIYVNGALDGGTTVAGNGTWSYQIVTSLPSYNPGVFDGLALIQATNTNLTGATYDIQLIIDTTISSPIGITYPRFNDSLYNNLPLIRGVAPPGTNVTINLDGVALTTVAADNSCKWEFKVTTPITNGNHTLDIGGPLTNFNVGAFTRFPLITYVESELDGFPIVNNLPLIKGVGIPGTSVSIYLNYVPYVPLGTVTIDANGNWSYQVVPVSYPDPISGIPQVLAPIRNGLSVVSTLLINNVVPINVTGFKLNRPAYSSITGVLDNTVFNTRLSPKHMMLNHKSLLASIMNKQRNDLIKFETADKNGNLRTVLGSVVTYERADIGFQSLGNPLAILEKAKVKCVAKKTFAQTLYDFNNGGTVKGTFKGNEVFFLPIGDMKMKNILDDVQEWDLLISPLTSYNKLLNLYKNGLTINLMQNSIFHSDYNSLHMVEYNFTQPDKFNFKSLYDDRFDDRNGAWMFGKTDYIQKYQKTEVIRDQIITNGISSMTLKIYRCIDAVLVDTINYNPVGPAPIPPPEIVLEAEIDWNDYPEGQYFCVAYVGETAVFISERVEVREKWYRTILIEGQHSVNKPGVFFSTGFKTIIRIEGLVKKLQPSIDTVIAKEESGDTTLLYSQIAKKRMIRFGNARGIPDYLGIKCACALTTDKVQIEGVLYSLEDGEKITPSDDIEGVPLYYYNVNMTLQENSQGRVFPGQPGAEVGGVTIVLDGTAIGLPAHSLIDIAEN